jgi:hypothetical protein
MDVCVRWRFRWWVYIGAEQRRSASASGRSWSGKETAPGLGTNHPPGSAPLHLPLMATVWAHKLSGWSVVSVVHLGVCDGHPQLVGPLAPPHAGRGVRSNTYTPLLPSFLSENECKINSARGGWCSRQSIPRPPCHNRHHSLRTTYQLLQLRSQPQPNPYTIQHQPPPICPIVSPR